MNWEKIFDFLWETAVSLGSKLIAAAVVLIVGWRFIKWFKKWLKTTKRIKRADDGVRSFLASFAGIAGGVVLFLTIVTILGIPTTSFITALASCGVAIGLALQGALGNFAGGIMIMLFKPFKVGDYITTPDAAGTVSEITVVYTILSTPANETITIPNGVLMNEVVVNASAVETRRVDLNFSVSYDSDVEKVKELLLSAVMKHEKVLKDPAPFARLSEHGESALVFTVRAWCKTDDFWDVKFDLIEDVNGLFKENGISIPFPQMDVHISNK